MTTAAHAGTCDRCNGLIRPGTSIVIRRGYWIHLSCAPGGDDE